MAAAAVRREEERRATGFAGGVEVPRILSTSFNALQIRLQALDLSLCGRPATGVCYNIRRIPCGLYRQSFDTHGAAVKRVDGFGF